MPLIKDWTHPPAEVQQAIQAMHQACASWQPPLIERPPLPTAVADAVPATVCHVVLDPASVDHSIWQIAEYSGMLGFLICAILAISGLYRLLLLPFLLPLRIARHYWGVPR